MNTNIYSNQAKSTSEGNEANSTVPPPAFASNAVPNAQRPPPPTYGSNVSVAPIIMQSQQQFVQNGMVIQPQQQFATQQVPLQVQYQNPNVAYQYQNAPPAQQTSYQAMGSIPQQNAMIMQQGVPVPRDWTFGPGECCDDMSACCLTTWCPCLTAGEIWDKGLEKTFCGGCCLQFSLLWILPWLISQVVYIPWIPFWIYEAAIYPFLWTGPLRARRGIEGNYIRDFCCVFWCGCCQMIQEVREAKLMQEERLTALPMNIPVQTVMI